MAALVWAGSNGKSTGDRAASTGGGGVIKGGGVIGKAVVQAVAVRGKTEAAAVAAAVPAAVPGAAPVAMRAPALAGPKIPRIATIAKSKASAP